MLDENREEFIARALELEEAAGIKDTDEVEKPRNRERVFIISIRKDCDAGPFYFPAPQELKLRIKDILEPEVDGKYYINSDRAKKFIDKITANPEIVDGNIENRIKIIGHLGTGGQKGWVFNANGISRCLATTDYKDPTKIVEPTPVICASDQKKRGVAVIKPRIKQLGNLLPDGRKFTNPQRGRVYDPDGLAPTLSTMRGGGLEPKFMQPVIIGGTQQHVIRKLTPLECFRLMGFCDEEFYRIKGVSNTQLYKQAGNSIVVNVLEAIFKQLHI